MKHLIIIAYILASCSTKPATSDSIKFASDFTNSSKQDLPIIDLSKRDLKKTISLKDIADIEYIPLETNNNNLVDWSLPAIVSKQYIIYHNKNGQILIFNRQGKNLYSFNHRGGGPSEYSSIFDLVLDETKNELYIEDLPNSKIYVYSIDGIFKRKLALPRTFFPDCLMNYDKDYLFCYNSYYMDKAEKRKMSAVDIKNRDNPYFFISKKTGELTSLDYNIPNRMGNQAVQMKEDGTIGTMHAMNIYPLAQNTPNILIAEFADDTLYSLKNGKLLPVMIKKPSAHKMVPPMMVGVDLFTDRYVFLYMCEKLFDKRPKSFYMVYDRQSNDFFRLDSKNYSIMLPLKGKASLPHNTGICFVDSEDLLENYRADKLEGELKEIASKLKEDDNPVLMLIKFKE